MAQAEFPFWLPGLYSLVVLVLRFLVLVICVTALCGVARAQRGELHQNFETPPQSKASGFPSLLNAEIVGKGAWHADLFGHVDYGVTKRTSVGVNVVALVGTASGEASMGLRGRHRFYSAGDLSSVVDLRYYKLGELSSFVVSSSTSLYRDYGTFTGTAFLAGMSGAILDSDVSIDVLGVAASYERYLLGPLGLSLTVGSIPALSGFLDSDGGSSGVSIRPGLRGIYERSVARGLLQLQHGRWLLGGGAFVPLSSPDAMSPWVEIAWTNN